MARNGNSNKGKKYIKLRGGEVATPQNEARARAFLDWYGAHSEVIRKRLIYDHLYDDDVATDTMLSVYDGIALKGIVVRDFKFYFLRAYHTNRLAAQKRKGAPTVSIDAEPRNDNGQAPGDYIIPLAERLAAPNFDYETHEITIDKLRTEILDYVRNNYDPASCSLFEIYITLQPDFSYRRVADMLGFKPTQVWTVIGAIRKDIRNCFAARKDFLLSCI